MNTFSPQFHMSILAEGTTPKFWILEIFSQYYCYLTSELELIWIEMLGETNVSDTEMFERIVCLRRIIIAIVNVR